MFDNSDDTPRTPLAVSVVIVITDVNDNAPQFPRKIIPMVRYLTFGFVTWLLFIDYSYLNIVGILGPRYLLAKLVRKANF